ncbi:hypothetical protein INT44_004721 [Umbelopsis vinacea]|uniref:Zn(2)-C6 fungal-type domain-containing protein n=1 Tax=Umbelopsis vinacea TaxID=44442 RepID=A0A8H7PFK3_9FUNG|nr:hypothetical protein INT44_004721 [Umbelopsis vinacea]KAI9280967.1 hypothetical protein BC943DRAFT_330233 [Umbelopsis sp. AD052]
MTTETDFARTACLQCRQIKVRCDKLANQSRCSRCLRLNFQCEFRPHARGRKPKSANTRHIPSRRDHYNNSNDDRSSGADSYENNDGDVAGGTLSLQAELNPSSISWTTAHTDDGCGKPNLLSKRSIAVASSYNENALTEGVIVESEARRLFEFFFRELNTMIALFDPYLHTIPYTMKNYPLVFSCIIAASAKFSRPDLYPACSEICNRLLCLAAVEDLCNLDHVQSLSILSFWKESSDTTDWRKIGRAIRMAFELNVHTAHLKTTNSSDEIVNREIMNRQRTWMQLCCFDAVFYNSINFPHTRPEMIPPECRIDPIVWYNSHLDWSLPGDARLACSLELDGVRRDIKLLKDVMAISTTPGTVNILIRAAQSRLKSFRNRWMNEKTVLPLDECTSAQTGYHLEIYSLKVNEVVWQYQQKTNAPLDDQKVTFASCVYDATTILRMLVDRVATQSCLRASQDWTFLGAAYAGKWLNLRRDHIDELTLREVVGVFNEVISVCSTETRSDDEPSAYLARFFQAMLALLKETGNQRSSTDLSVSSNALIPNGQPAVPGMDNMEISRSDLLPVSYAPIKLVDLNTMANLQDHHNPNTTASFIDLFVQDAEYWDSMFSNWHTI